MSDEFGFLKRPIYPDGHKMEVSDAQFYLAALKQKLPKEVSKQIIDLMLDMKNHNITALEVVQGVERLLKGHKDLKAGYNMFLPSFLKMEVNDE